MASESNPLHSKPWIWDSLITEWLDTKPEAEQKSAKESPQIALGNDGKTVRVFRTVDELNEASAQGPIKFHRVSLKEFPNIAKTGIEGERSEEGIPATTIFQMVRVCVRFYQEESLNKSAVDLESEDNKCLNKTIDELAYEASKSLILERNENLSTLKAIAGWRDEKGNNFLHRAVEAGNLTHVQELLNVEQLLFYSSLAEHSLVSSVNNKKETPVHIAVTKDNMSILEEFKKWTNYGNNLLHFAVKSGDLPYVKVLLLLDVCLYSPLLSNEANGQIHQSLVNFVNGEGNTPIHLAAELGNLEIMTALLQSAVFANLPWTTAQNRKGRTPLHIAVEKNNKEMVDLIKDTKCSYVHTLNSKSSTFQTFLMKLKFVPDYAMNRPVHIAAEKGYSELVPLLMDETISLMYNSSFRNAPERISLLYDGFRNDKGDTPLSIATSKGDSKTVTAIGKAISKDLYLAADIFLCPNNGPKFLDRVRESDKTKNSNYEQIVMQSLPPLQKVFVTICDVTYEKVECISNLLQNRHLYSRDGAFLCLRAVMEIYDTTFVGTLEPHRQYLFKYVDGYFRATLERIRVKVEQRLDLGDESEHLSLIAGYLNGFVEDATMRPVREVIQSLEASMNTLFETIRQNRALDETYYDSFITLTDIALRKFAALSVIIKIGPADVQELMHLITDLGSMNKLAKEQKAALVEAIASCKDDKQKKEVLGKLGLKLITKEEGEGLMKTWSSIKDSPMRKVQPESNLVHSQQAQEDQAIATPADLILQDNFNQWEKDNPKFSQALRDAIQNANQEEFGAEIKEALELKMIENNRLLGLIVLDHILIQNKKEIDSLITFFQPAQKSAKLSEQEEKEADEKNKKLAEALNSLFTVIQKHRIPSAEQPWEIAQIAQRLIMPTEKDKLTDYERVALKSFNDVIASFPIDAKIFYAISKFSVWPIFSPTNSRRYNTLLDGFRAQQLRAHMH